VARERDPPPFRLAVVTGVAPVQAEAADGTLRAFVVTVEQVNRDGAFSDALRDQSMDRLGLIA
jgi:hypothetical protein